MNQGLKQFENLLRTDTEFQEKLKTAADNYKGNMDDRSVFEGLLVPLAKEYGITATYDEFQEYLESLRKISEGECVNLSQDELEQVAGGKSGGLGAVGCSGVGSGIGFSGGDNGISACICLGGGNHEDSICATAGTD